MLKCAGKMPLSKIYSLLKKHQTAKLLSHILPYNKIP